MQIPKHLLIYAHADAEMKRETIKKATVSSNPICAEFEMTKSWENDEELLLMVYGLK